MLLQIIIDTLVRTSQLSLVAVGLSMTWGIVRFANVAHVQFAPVGAYLALVAASSVGLGLVPGSLVGILAAGLLGVLLHLFFFRRLSSFSSATALIGSLALSIVITATIQTIAGPRPERLPIVTAPGLRIGDAVLTRTQMYIVALTAVIFLVLFLVLAYTSAGRAVRCAAVNPDLASASGMDVRRVSTLVVFLAAALAGTGGVFIAADTSISLEMGSTLLLAVFAAVIMGGIGSIGGALLASAVLALVESTVLRIDFGSLVGAGPLLVPVSYRPAVGFVAVILVMLFRPQGLFGFGGRRA